MTKYRIKDQLLLIFIFIQIYNNVWSISRYVRLCLISPLVERVGLIQHQHRNIFVMARTGEKSI